MKRRLLNFLTAVSLLLFVAVAGLWARSGVEGDTWTASVSGWSLMVRSDRGRLAFAVRRDPGTPGGVQWLRSPGVDHDVIPGRPVTSPPEVLGIRYASGTFSYARLNLASPVPVRFSGRFWWLRVYFVHVLPLLLLAAIPGIVVRVRERRRAARGLCVQCGYDLRASGGRCPECGTPGPGRESAALAASGEAAQILSNH